MTSLDFRQVELLAMLVSLPFLAFLVAHIRTSWLLSLGLAAEVFSGHWRTIGIPLPVDRLLLLGAFAAFALNPQLRREVRRNISWITLVIAALVAWTIVSGLQNGTIIGGRGFWALFDRLGLFPFAAFILGPIVFREKQDRDVFLKVFVCLGAYLSVTAVFEVIGPNALVFPSYITDPSISMHWGRSRGPFVESVANGMAIFSCGVVGAVAATMLSSARWRRAAWVIVALCALGAFLSLTRSVWLGGIAGSVAALVVMPQTRKYVLQAVVVGTVSIASVIFFCARHARACRESSGGAAPRL